MSRHQFSKPQLKLINYFATLDDQVRSDIYDAANQFGHEAALLVLDATSRVFDVLVDYDHILAQSKDYPAPRSGQPRSGSSALPDDPPGAASEIDPAETEPTSLIDEVEKYIDELHRLDREAHAQEPPTG